MKKFLTVLLALSVVFTYTVGSAFATATTDEITDASAYAENRLTAVTNAHKAELLAAKTYDVAAIDKANADAVVVGRQVANDLITMYKEHGSFANAFKTNFDAWATADVNASGLSSKEFAYAKGTYVKYFNAVITKYDFEAKVANAVAAVNAVDTSVYAESKYTVMENGKNVDYTYRSYADKLKADTLATLQNPDKVKEANYVTEIKNILYGSGDKDSVVAGQGFFGKLKNLKTTEEVTEDEKRSEANIAYAKAILAHTAKFDYYDSVKKAEGDSVSLTADGKYMGVVIANPSKITKAEASAINAAIMKEIDKALEVANVYYDEECKDPVAEAKAVNRDNFKSCVIDKALPAIAVYEAYAEKAADKKAELLFDGTKMYDDAAIDAALAKDKTEIYAKAFTAAYTVESFKAKSAVLKVAPVTDPVANAIEDAKEKFEGEIIYAGADKTPEADRMYKAEYYAAEVQNDYQTIKADTIEALHEAKTIDEVKAIMADADKKLAELRTAKQASELKASDVQKYETALVEYLDEQKALMGKDYRADSFTAIKDAYNGTSVKPNEGKFDIAKDAAHLAALYAEAKNAVANLKKDAELKAEAGKVTALIAALPATVDPKLSTEKQFMEAKDAYEAFIELYGAKSTEVAGVPVFLKKLEMLKIAQQNAVTTASKELVELKPYEVADKAAVNAVKAKYEEYVKYYDQYDEAFNADITELEKAVAAVRTAEINAVEAMIKKLDKNSTAEELKAALDAYNALTGSQQRAVKAKLGEAFLYKLELMQSAKIEAVKALKITASSVAKKGSITVKWKVKGDVSSVEAYEIYKSTKKNKGFKKAFTTKTGDKRWYKNTAGLKKGTRYYYKVRAVAHDLEGNKITSDWSNKAYRLAK